MVKEYDDYVEEILLGDKFYTDTSEMISTHIEIEKFVLEEQSVKYTRQPIT